MLRPAPLPLAAVALICLAALPGPAYGDGGHGGREDRVRTDGTCSSGLRASLQLKSDDAGIEAEFELQGARRGSSWRVVLVHERRVVTRRTVHAGRGSGALRLDSHVADLPGADRVTVRADGPQGRTCTAAATLAGA